MAHWFHRNPIKATIVLNFELKGVSTNGQTSKICSDLRQTRKHLLDLLANARNEIPTMEKAVENYFSLLQGFIEAPDDKGESKLRKQIVKYKWTNTMCGNAATESYDAMFEVVSMGINVGLWYTKHAAYVAASKEVPTMDEAKEVHKCLRLAAGIFAALRDKYIGNVMESPEDGTDLDARVITAYVHQSTAEAQEVTLARAIELEHSSSLISGLAYETSQMFRDADLSLSTLDEKIFTKWRKYFQLKQQFYLAYAYSYHGETLLASDKCGEAIKTLQESVKCYEQAGVLSKEYSAAKGHAKPTEHLFFRKLGPVAKRTLEKCTRENGFIYHQKIPPEIPDLELKATYGLASPEEFNLPSRHSQWTQPVYEAFDISQVAFPRQPPKEEKKKPEELPPVKEEEIDSTKKDPKNSSGCTVS